MATTETGNILVGNGQEKCVTLPIAVLAPDPVNPRTMSDEARAGLAVSLETFGALDIVFNDTTGELVSGHQRLDGLKAAGATELVREGDWGFVIHPKTGERFPVRFVRWDSVKHRLANFVSNSPHLQGEFSEAGIGQLRALEGEANFGALGLDKLVAQLEAELGPVEEGRGVRPEQHPRGAGRADLSAGGLVDLGRPPVALWGRDQGRGRGATARH